MLTKDQFQALAKKAIALTTFPECSINLSSTENAFIRFALNGVTTSGFVADQSLGISVTRMRRRSAAHCPISPSPIWMRCGCPLMPPSA